MKTVSLKDIKDLTINPEDRPHVLKHREPEVVKKTDRERLADSIESMSKELIAVSKNSTASMEMVTKLLAESLRIMGEATKELGKKRERKPIKIKIDFKHNRDGSTQSAVAKVREI